MKRTLVAVILAGLILAVLAQARSQTLIASSSSPHVGDSVFLSGCGYKGKNSIWVKAPGESLSLVATFNLLPGAPVGVDCFNTAEWGFGYTVTTLGGYEFFVYRGYEANGRPLAELVVEAVL